MAAKKKKSDSSGIQKLLIFMIIAVATAIITGSCVFIMSSGEKPQPDIGSLTTAEETTEEITTTEPDLTPYIVSTVTVASAGDVLIHKPILENAKESADVYSFDKLFTYISDTTSAYDYFVLNLETTLAGNEGRSYSTYPCFNSPDSLLDSLSLIGTDCLLTANNHSYDTGASGFYRTYDTVDSYGFDHIGSRTDLEGSKFIIKNVGGIDFGFICYTYETEYDSSTVKALNGIPMNSETSPLINSFDYDHLNTFYTEIEEQLTLMKQSGAQVLTVYMHWGDEYKLSANHFQKDIAARLCDMGVDVIIGGHPHVVQPVELLTSSDGAHKTVCIYSVGNFLSNQRRSLMPISTGHTEDGAIFEMTFSEYSDGTVYFESVSVTPTWVHLYNENGGKVHSVVPLSENMDASALGLDKTDAGLKNAQESYDRTMALVGAGLEDCNAYLASIPRPGQEPADTPSNNSTDVTEEYSEGTSEEGTSA